MIELSPKLRGSGDVKFRELGIFNSKRVFVQSNALAKINAIKLE